MNETHEFELVLFGGLGDLATRKLIPALYMLHCDQRLEHGKIFIVTRQALDRSEFLKKIEHVITTFVAMEWRSPERWQRFSDRLCYVHLDVGHPPSFQALKEQLSASNQNRVFYLATGSELYAPICTELAQTALIHSGSKVVLEKPIGHDFETAQALNETVKQYFLESQIYRIDHYLGKETVQNLLVLRFANSIFEHQWNQKYIDNIQITISETLGVENRAAFYEGVGATRDMLQNHLLQLLCITAMEPPASLHADAVRDEKVKVLKALKPLNSLNINQNMVCGQYEAGLVAGKAVSRYRAEKNVDAHSSTDTFVAMKVEIDNWRWAGVPFYLRTGKRMAEKMCEIVVYFKEVPHSIFPVQHKSITANKLVFRLQPDDGIRMQLCEKRIGPGMKVRPVNLSLNPATTHHIRVPEAYERLLQDVLHSNPTLFLRDDELLAAWQWLNPALSFWQAEEQRPEPYAAGSWGPAAATLLLAKDGRLWSENN